MAIYVYTPGNRRALRSETIGLEGRGLTKQDADRDVARERHTLLNVGMNAVSRGTVRSKEVSRQLAKADPERLPVELLSRVMDRRHYPAPIVNMDPRAFGTAMRPRGGGGAPYFEVAAEKVEKPGELAASGRLDPDALGDLIFMSALASSAVYSAVQYQPFVSEDHRLQVATHESFGYMEGGQYHSVLTALSREYQMRDAIEQARQGQPA